MHDKILMHDKVLTIALYITVFFTLAGLVYAGPLITIENPINNSLHPADTRSVVVEIDSYENARCVYSAESDFDYAEGTEFDVTQYRKDHRFNFSGMTYGQDYTLYYLCNNTNGMSPKTTHIFRTRNRLISSSISAEPTNISAEISWETNLDSDSLVRYGTEPGSYSASESSETMTDSHSIGLTGLLSDQTYYYIVESIHNATLSNISSERNFTTIDTIRPNITDEEVTSLSPYSATITWETDETSDSVIRYGISSGDYIGVAMSSSLVRLHSVIMSLDQDTGYFYVIESTDSDGNTRRTSEFNLTTPPDVTAPTVTKIRPNGSVDDDEFNLTIRTNEVATCKYNLEDHDDASYNNLRRTFETSDNMTHYHYFRDIENGDYEYYVRCRDHLGNTMNSSEIIEVDVDREIIDRTSYKPLSTHEYRPPEKTEEKSWENLMMGSTYEWVMQDKFTPLRKIRFDIRDDMENLAIMIKEVSEEPIAKFRMDRKVNEYMSVEVTSGSVNRMANIEFSFDVEQRWLRLNDVAPESIRLFRYSDGWKELDTEIDSIGASIHYTAKVPGFSLFAVSYDPSITGSSEPNAGDTGNESKSAESSSDGNLTINRTGEPDDLTEGTEETNISQGLPAEEKKEDKLKELNERIESMEREEEAGPDTEMPYPFLDTFFENSYIMYVAIAALVSVMLIFSVGVVPALKRKKAKRKDLAKIYEEQKKYASSLARLQRESDPTYEESYSKESYSEKKKKEPIGFEKKNHQINNDKGKDAEDKNDETNKDERKKDIKTLISMSKKEIRDEFKERKLRESREEEKKRSFMENRIKEAIEDNTIEEDIESSPNSAEFYEHELENSKKAIDEEMEETQKETEEEIKLAKELEEKKTEESYMKNVHLFIVKKYITENLKRGVPKERIVERLSSKGFQIENIGEIVEGIQRSLNLDKKLNELSDKLWKRYGLKRTPPK